MAPLRNAAGVIGFAVTLALVLVALFAGSLAPADPFAIVGPALDPPSWTHPLGTDNLGRDTLTCIIHGINTSMTVVLWVVAISAVIGCLVGVVAGYCGGFVDDALMRFTELFQSVPRFFLAMLTIALFGRGLDNLIILLGLTSWTLLARVVRAETLSLRSRPMVEAARSYGASAARILARHVFPNVIPAVSVVVSLMASRVILIEAGLAFLGLGDQDRMSLGLLASYAQGFLQVAWWMAVAPGAVIALAVLGLNLLSDALNDHLGREGASQV